jgi:FKBP-type peptidyl-prolyl cis-trans isomerase 2
MESEPKPQKVRDPQKMLMTLVIAGIVISVGAIGYILYSGTGAPHVKSSRAIAVGDSVELNYIGTLADGRVFDTSLQNVANDNVLYPKSLTFTNRGNSSYTVFTMTAGAYGTSGGTIKGFALGVIGMHVNETKLIEVLPQDGYAVDPTMIQTKDIVEEIPATETFSSSDFVTRFGIEPILMRTVHHFFWGWDALIVYNSSGLVKIKYLPTVGQVVYPYGDPNGASPSGWPVVVESFDPSASNGVGKVVIRHVLNATSVYNVKGQDMDGVEFVVSGFNATNGTFETSLVDAAKGYNGELAGRTLFFEVTIVKVTAA